MSSKYYCAGIMAPVKLTTVHATAVEHAINQLLVLLQPEWVAVLLTKRVDSGLFETSKRTSSLEHWNMVNIQ